MLGVIEINADERTTGHVVFDLDDIDAAFDELDKRYLVGEAAVHARTWSVIAGIYASFNRHELSPTTPDWVNTDHRRGIAFGPGDMTAYIRAGSDLTPDTRIYVETVHRLSNLGAVVTQVMKGTSRDGFDAEWREIGMLMFEGDLISRCEMFDEVDLDAALARFDELHPRARRLENKASRAGDRFFAYFGTRNWAAIAEILTDDSFVDDRRRVVNAGFWDGRDVVIANMRALQEGGANITSTVVATRGERLALIDICSANRDQRQGEFGVEMLGIAEIDTDERIAAHVLFDVDDIDAAFAELDARYLAGEAAAHSHTWSVHSGFYAGFNRQELPATTPDWIYIDHRPLVTIEANDLPASMRAIWDLAPDISIYMEAVHRLSDLGAVATAAVYGSSQEGFDAEWRIIDLFTVEGDLASRCEIFDEADLDAALARFDELERPASRLENAATRTWVRLVDALNRRDVDGFLALSTADGQLDDRRKGLRALLDGPARRKAAHALFRAPESWRMEVEPVAIRGYRLGLTRERWRDTDEADRPITVEAMTLTEITDDELVYHTVVFDPDDINGAFAELTDRWIASGEVAHPEVIMSVQRLTEAINRHDWDAFATLGAGVTYVNHRQLSSPGVQTITDHMSSIRTMASLVPDLWVEQAEILTQSAMGLVNHVVLRGTSTDGVAIEIPYVVLILLDGDRVTRFETFDADQRDLALARFEELAGVA
jgi:hypothetical protein